MNMMQDPWYLGMIITLILFLLLLAWAARPLYRDLVLLAIALPQALFKKLFGDPPSEEDGH